MPITVHLVFNAHLDPVWLWPWQAGLGEALATCRSACDRLDAHPELIFTRGEAWVYEQVERCDPELFERIRRHIDAGRWEIVGGWYIQPDCNGPSAWAMDWQVELGRDYFMDRFGKFPRVAYNVDSFGHSAYLPTLLSRHGQDRYVMMRPQEHEMSLPARLFRWRGEESGPEATVFRIAGSYAARDISESHVLDSLRDLPEGCEHTMCFVWRWADRVSNRVVSRKPRLDSGLPAGVLVAEPVLRRDRASGDTSRRRRVATARDRLLLRVSPDQDGGT